MVQYKNGYSCVADICCNQFLVNGLFDALCVHRISLDLATGCGMFCTVLFF